MANASKELDDIKKLYDLDSGSEDHKRRLKVAADIRKDIEGTFKTVHEANEIVQALLTEDMKVEVGFGPKR